MSYEFDTIVAPATPLGRSAIAVVRVDGAGAVDAVRRLSRDSELLDRHPSLRLIATPEGEAIDEAVVTFFQAPRSYTGNDLVEIATHGNPEIVEHLIETFRSLGVRLAEPGEFTERAVLNGRLDLVQAEAVADLIASRTKLQARLFLGTVRGELSRLAMSAREGLLFIISRLEGALDFADEGYEFISREKADETLRQIEHELGSLLETYARGRAVRSGLTAVILGRPNAGKSTLMNLLCGSERAIVTPVAGTTRDLIRETVEIGGLPVTFIDTAGLRPTLDSVEEIGVARAREAAAEADLVLYLVDSSLGISSEDAGELQRHPEATIVYTKSDLASPPAGAIAISAVTRHGVPELLTFLDDYVRMSYLPPENSPALVNERQRAAVADSAEALASSRESLQAAASEELVLVDLYRASHALGSLTGEITNDEVLAEIFSKFCIGK